MAPRFCGMKTPFFVLTLFPLLALRIFAGPADLAKQLLERAELNRGLCAVAGAPNDLALEFAKASELLVHVRHPDLAVVEQLRQAADEAGLDIQRLAAEQGNLETLPYATNSVDLLVTLGATPVGEIRRVLRPKGIALIGAATQNELLEMWSHAATKTFTGEGLAWMEWRKPPLEGADEWSHWEKSPANNPVSRDQHIKAPYMTQFMAEPYYIGMPAITTVAGGRTFLAMGHIAHHEREWEMLNRLIARNGYNGQILWERKLPDDYLVHRSAFVATKDTFFMIDGDHVLKLDARTGEEQGKLEIPALEGAWKWIGMVDGVLYALAGEPGPGVETVKGNRALGGWSWGDLSKGYYGKRIPHGFGDQIAAYHVADEEVLWMHREESLIDARGLAIQDENFYLYCPDKHLRCLDRQSGEIRWTNAKELDLSLIEEPGKGLTSTPGWRTQSIIVATPEVLVVQGQTRMNVLGLSTGDGSMLWHKSKVTNNPNAIFVDGEVILGVGPSGSHLAIDPLTGTVSRDLRFYKRACTRLTASPDSFFTRGEGMQRIDRATGRVTVDGAVRPACNDGVIPANGLLYLGPWACDCNLSLIGNVARCSAGDFRFDRAVEASRQLHVADQANVEADAVAEADWPTYRSDSARSSSTPAKLRNRVSQAWIWQPERTFSPTESTSAYGLIYFGGSDGRVRALDAKTGEQRWKFATGGVVKYPPTIADGRAWFGSGDGHVYCVEAASGRLLWRFRASPTERHIMIYGALSSTWPVNTGVLVEGGTAYFAAGIVDHDGTYVYALDAASGQVKWVNNTSGHLNAELRKGVSAQGNLGITGNTLLLSGGNVVSPAAFDLETGACLETPRENGNPQNNGGKFVGVFGGKTVIQGGRILYSSPRNVSTKGSFDIWSAERKKLTLNFGGIPPAWNGEMMAVANFKFGKITAFEAEKLAGRIASGFEGQQNRRSYLTNTVVHKMASRAEEKWQANFGDNQGFEPLSLVVAPNAVLSVARYQDLRRARKQWILTAMNAENGAQMFQADLPAEPLPGGLIVDSGGRILVSLLEGGMACY